MVGGGVSLVNMCTQSHMSIDACNGSSFYL